METACPKGIFLIKNLDIFYTMWKDFFRVQQWYKNLLIFLPLVFVGLATDMRSVALVSVGFIALCLMSSANYILNDIVDRKKDVLHPEKKNRPIASGKISLYAAASFAFLCATLALLLASSLSKEFFIVVLIFFLITQLYSVFLKKEIFVDIIAIAVNFVLRAISGAYILHVRISPWLIVCTFFLAIFIAAGKRRAESLLLKGNARKHRYVLALYTPEITNALMLVSTGLLLLSYSLYTFLSLYPQLLYTLPLSFYAVFRYYFLVESKSTIARNPELFYTDKRLWYGISFWLAAVLVLLYAI